MIYLGRAIVRPFPDLIDFVAFHHAKWALVVNKIYGIRSGVSALRIFRSFSVSILSESVTPRRQIDVGRIMRLWKDERLAQCSFGRSLLCFFAIGHAIRLVVSLHCGTKQFQCERLVHYCSIDKRSVGKAVVTITGMLRVDGSALSRPRATSFLSRVRNGRPVKSIRTAFERAIEKAAIEDLRLHDFRHTCIRRWATEGIPQRS